MCEAVYGLSEGYENEQARQEGIPDLSHFSSGIGDRSVTIRIPLAVADAGFGYFEDRRPLANCDPYPVTEAIIRSLTDTV